MADRKKVIKGLDACLKKEDCSKCPYTADTCVSELTNDVWELLEAKKPIKKSDMYFCADCKTALARTQSYCHKCGRAVKWDDTGRTEGT